MLAETYPISTLCQVLDCRRSYYYQGQVADETALKQALEQVATQWPTYGYRRLKKQLQRDTGQIVNHKKMQQLMDQLGLVVKKKAKKRRTTNSHHPWPPYPNLGQDLEIVQLDFENFEKAQLHHLGDRAQACNYLTEALRIFKQVKTPNIEPLQELMSQICANKSISQTK